MCRGCSDVCVCVLDWDVKYCPFIVSTDYFAAFWAEKAGHWHLVKIDRAISTNFLLNLMFKKSTTGFKLGNIIKYIDTFFQFCLG